jgi:hypothetical protein
VAKIVRGIGLHVGNEVANRWPTSEPHGVSETQRVRDRVRPERYDVFTPKASAIALAGCPHRLEQAPIAGHGMSERKTIKAASWTDVYPFAGHAIHLRALAPG